MKEILELHNFGPIKQASIEVNKYTIFIGELSCGKSIIMRMLAFCKWLQKKAVLYNCAYNKTYGFIFDILESSKLDQFIYKNTKILFKGQYFDIEINGTNPITCRKNSNKNFEYLDKILFISDDRLIVPILDDGMPIQGKVPFYAMNSYIDFIKAISKNQTNNINQVKANIDNQIKGSKNSKSTYTKKFNSNILDYELGTLLEGDKEKTVIKNKNGSIIDFYNASSGVKSLGVIEAVFNKIINEKDNTTTIKDFINNTYLYELNLAKDSKEQAEEKVIKELNNRFVNVFLEEPEMNLYPKHQFELMKYLIYCANVKNNINYVLLTHSPYILSSINCFLQASRVKNINKAQKILDTHYWIDYKDVSAYECKDNTVVNILDETNGIIFAENIDSVTENIDYVFDELVRLEFDE